MDTDKATPSENTELTNGDWLIGWSIITFIGWVIYQILGLAFHLGAVNYEMNNVISAYNERALLAREVVGFMNSNQIGDTGLLTNALREIERAQILLDRSGVDAKTFSIYEQQHDELNKALEAVEKLVNHTDAGPAIMGQLEENAQEIEIHREDYNNAALDFNLEYSISFPERYMGVHPRILLSETEAIGLEFAPLYGTPTSGAKGGS